MGAHADATGDHVAGAVVTAAAPKLGPERAAVARMEQAFGADFSDVKIEENDRPAALGATAFTAGNEIHFARGTLQPGTARGDALLGHELTHVLQQRAGGTTAPQAKGGPVNADPALESQADDLGARAARGESIPAGAVSAATAPGAQRTVGEGLEQGTVVKIEKQVNATSVNDHGNTRIAFTGKGRIVAPLKAGYKVKVTDASKVVYVGKEIPCMFDDLTLETPDGSAPVPRHQDGGGETYEKATKAEAHEEKGGDEPEQAPIAAPRHDDSLESRRRQLSQMRRNARRHIDADEHPMAVMARISNAMDTIFDEILRHVLQTDGARFVKEHCGGSPYCWVAIGSYGRRETSAYSDVDVALIFEKGDKQQQLGFIELTAKFIKPRIDELGEREGYHLCKKASPTGEDGQHVVNSAAQMGRTPAVQTPYTKLEGYQTALHDARPLEVTGSSPTVFLRFTAEKEHGLDQITDHDRSSAHEEGWQTEYVDEEEREQRKRNRSAKQFLLVREATGLSLIRDGGRKFSRIAATVRQQLPTIDVKEDVRKGFDLIVSGLAVMNRIQETNGLVRVIELERAKAISPDWAALIQRAMVFVAEMRIRSHLANRSEYDTVETGFSHAEPVAPPAVQLPISASQRELLRTLAAVVPQITMACERPELFQQAVKF